MITEEILKPLISAELLHHEEPEFFAGALVGIKHTRPTSVAEEAQMLDSAHAAAKACPYSYDTPLFARGLTFGIQLRLEAEKNATQLFKFLGGALPRLALKRITARRRQCERFLQGLHLTQKILLEDAYERRYGIGLADVILESFSERHSTALLKILRPLASEGDNSAQQLRKCDVELSSARSTPAQCELLELQMAARKRGARWLGHFFLGRTDEERLALRRAYESQFEPLTAAVDNNFSGWERDFLLDLINHGSVGWGKLLYLCVAGVGTDEDGLHDLLAELPPEALPQAREEFHKIWLHHAPWYERPFPNLLGNLDRRIWVETGGDSFFDLREYLKGLPHTTDTFRERLERLYRHERSGLLLKKLDFFSREGTTMDRDVGAVREFYQSFVKGKQPDQITLTRFEVMIQYAELNCEVFRSLKHFIGNGITNMVAATCVAGATFALTLEHVQVETIMVTVAGISIVLRLGLKSLLKGRGYHPSELTADVVFGALDGATLFASYLFRQAMIRFGTKILTTLSMRTGIVRISKLMGSNRTQRWGVTPSELAGM